MIFNIAIFLLVLGILIFIHEMGHFLAAKACGVYVDRFSLGMPPRLFGFKYGETDYCVGLLPIGGYVKMAGQEDAPMEEEEREATYGHVPQERWFSSKSKAQRAIILFAGPAMNLVLGFVVYGLIGAMGFEVPAMNFESRIGTVMADMPAADAPMFLVTGALKDVDTSGEPDARGWRTGDYIRSIDGDAVSRPIDILYGSALNGDEVVQVEIERALADGSTARYLSPILPRLADKDAALATFGIGFFQTALVSSVMPGTPADAAGIRSGDIVRRSDGAVVDRDEFSKKVRELESDVPLQIEIGRGGETLDFILQPETEGEIEGLFFKPAIRPVVALRESQRLTLDEVSSALASRTGLRKGDTVISLDGDTAVDVAMNELRPSDSDTLVSVEIERPARFFGLLGRGSSLTVNLSPRDLWAGRTGADIEKPPEVAGATEAVTKATDIQRRDTIVEIDGQPATIQLLRDLGLGRIGDTIPVKVHRPALFLGIGQKEKNFDTEITISSKQRIGVVWGIDTVMHKVPAAELIPHAWNESARAVKQVGSTLHALITGNVSPKALGGPVMIFQVTVDAANSSLNRLLGILAMISVNLAIFNLLPLPVLDGGQLVFIGIEAIRRKPVSVRTL
ncbi:MAG: site-2 protease family protein, partial [Candidatus Hydrogenedentes bacterium]|nr:site-2 protease family protein [Candidatus Hydrogenedentota bacterium]